MVGAVMEGILLIFDTFGTVWCYGERKDAVAELAGNDEEGGCVLRIGVFERNWSGSG